MPLNLTAEEVARLSGDQLDAYARVHLDSQRARRKLCDQANGRNRSVVFPIVAGVVGVGAVILFPRLMLQPITFTVLAIALLFRFHIRTNRRIDALVRLLDIDRVADYPLAGQANADRPATAPKAEPEKPSK